jgi:hypothetical protein
MRASSMGRLATYFTSLPVSLILSRLVCVIPSSSWDRHNERGGA